MGLCYFPETIDGSNQDPRFSLSSLKVEVRKLDEVCFGMSLSDLAEQSSTNTLLHSMAVVDSICIHLNGRALRPAKISQQGKTLVFDPWRVCFSGQELCIRRGDCTGPLRRRSMSFESQTWLTFPHSPLTLQTGPQLERFRMLCLTARCKPRSRVCKFRIV